MKIKNVFLKLLVSVLIVLTLANFISAINVDMNYSFATTDEGEERTNGLLERFINNIAKALFDFVKGLILAPFRAARSINYLLASSGGVTGGTPTAEISPFDIFFNRFTLLDANIFSTTDRDGNALDPDSVVYKIRTNAAVWYYAIRTLSIGVISIMLLWNLLRSISKNTTAEQKSIAKSSLTDWVLSFALVMFMHIIVIIVLNFNDLLLDGIQSFTPFANTKDFFDALENAVFSTNLVLGIACLIVYALLNWQTFKYILIYIQRFLTIVLLVMISPIIPVTYSTDKMRGGRGGALNNWLKELIFNVFIQTLHAIIYAALVGVAMASLTSASSITGVTDLGNAIVAIAAMLFIKYAERMVKTIFGFDASTVLNTNVFKDAATTVTNFAGMARSAVTGIPNGRVPFGQNIGGIAGSTGSLGGGIAGGIGFGQNIPGIGASTPNAGGLTGGVRQGVSTVLNGIGGQGTMLGGIANVATGGQSASGLANGILGIGSGNADATADAEASAYAEATATATAEDGADGEDGTAVVIDAGGGESVEEALKDKNQDAELARLREEQDDDNARAEENMTAEEKRRQQFEEFMKNRQGESSEEHTETEEVVNQEHTESVEEPTIVNNEQTEVVEETGEGGGIDPDVLKEQIETAIQDKLSPEVEEKLQELLESDVKPELIQALIDAIGNDDPEKLAELKAQVSEQLKDLGQQMDSDTVANIEERIDATWTDKEKRDEYIHSLPENSKERNYAQMYAAMSALDDDTMSKQERVETVVMSGALDTEKMKLKSNWEPTGDENRQSQVNAANAQPAQVGTAGVSTAGNARVMKAVNEANSVTSQPNPESEGTAEFDVQPDPEIEDIKNDDLREMMVDLAEIDPVRYRVKGKLDGEIQNEIQEEFTATIEEFTEKMGREPKGLKDIYDGMDKKARKQFADYKTGQLSPKELEGDAKALATLEIQARHLGFAMEIGQTYEYSVDGGPQRTASSSSAVITDLAAERQRRQNMQTQTTRNQRNSA